MSETKETLLIYSKKESAENLLFEILSANSEYREMLQTLAENASKTKEGETHE